MKRLVIYLGMAILAGFVVNAPMDVVAKDSKVITIGVVYPLSGPNSLHCDGILTAHKVAADEIMKAGGFQGRRIEFIARDDASNPELTTRYCRELILKNNVDWIFSGFGSAIGLAAAAVGKELKTPTFIFGGKTEKITTEDWNQYTFRYQVTCTAEARAAAKILAGEIVKGVANPKIFWISWDFEYGRSLYGPFVAKMKELLPNATLVGEAWPRIGETDYGPFLNQMMALGPDVVVSSVLGGAVSLVKQGRGMGLWEKTTLLTLAEIASIESRVANGLDLPEGTWGNTFDDVVWPANEGQKKFYEAYRNFTGKPQPPTGFAAPGYYMMYLIDAAMKKSKSVAAEKVMKAMEGISIDTYWGPLTIRDFDHQVISGQIWAPMIKKEGLPYLVLDVKRARYVPCGPDLYTKEEWLAKRKAAGK